MQNQMRGNARVRMSKKDARPNALGLLHVSFETFLVVILVRLHCIRPDAVLCCAAPCCQVPHQERRGDSEAGARVSLQMESGASVQSPSFVPSYVYSWYFQPYIKPYKERLIRLINESTFREEMTLFDVVRLEFSSLSPFGAQSDVVHDCSLDLPNIYCDSTDRLLRALVALMVGLTETDLVVCRAPAAAW